MRAQSIAASRYLWSVVSTCLSADHESSVRCGSLCVGSPWSDVAPISDGNAYDVEAGVLDLPEVVERDKIVPMRLQNIRTGLLSDLLAQRPLIDDGRLGSTVALKDGRGDETWVVSPEQTFSAASAYGSRTSQPLYISVSMSTVCAGRRDISPDVDSSNLLAAPIEVDASLAESAFVY